VRLNGWLHKLWWHWGDGGWLGWPWIWRPYCWLRGHHENDSYDSCVFCGIDMRAPAPKEK
jgi:hypothetical protein